MNFWTCSILWCASIVGASLAVSASNLSDASSAVEVMQATYDKAHEHAQQSADLYLGVSNGRGGVKEHKLRVRYRDFGDKSKTLMRLFEPRSLVGIGLLSESYHSKPKPTQWIYLPRFRKVRKLSTSAQNQSFLGSDLTRRDLAGRTVNTDAHTMLANTMSYWEISSVPHDEDDVYSRIDSQIDKEKLYVRKAVFYDREGNLLKTLENKQVMLIEGVYMPVDTLVTNHKKGTQTNLRRLGVDVLTDVPPNAVGLRALQRR